MRRHTDFNAALEEKRVMFCPQCGTETNEPIKFCKQCGTNLRRVMGVMGKGGAGFKTGESVDWEKEGLEARRERRAARNKKTPEEKRFEEIKAGVITSSVGLGVMIFLGLLFGAISQTVNPDAAWILRAIPFAGVIPFLIGLGIIFNGLFISKRIVELKHRQEQRDQPMPLFTVPNTSPVARLAESSQPPISDFSIAEPTTTKLREPVSAPSPRETS
jgi:hypothetical protein